MKFELDRAERKAERLNAWRMMVSQEMMRILAEGWALGKDTQKEIHFGYIVKVEVKRFEDV